MTDYELSLNNTHLVDCSMANNGIVYNVFIYLFILGQYYVQTTYGELAFLFNAHVQNLASFSK